MVDWILEFSGAKTVVATGQNDKNNENSDPVFFLIIFARHRICRICKL